MYLSLSLCVKRCVFWGLHEVEDSNAVESDLLVYEDERVFLAGFSLKSAHKSKDMGRQSAVWLFAKEIFYFLPFITKTPTDVSSRC